MNNFNGDDVAAGDVVNWRGEQIRFIYEKVLKGRHGSVMEFGCANADLLSVLSRPIDYYGVDFNKDIISGNKAKYVKDSVTFSCEEFNEAIKGEYGCWDTMHCVCTLFYMKDALAFVEKMFKASMQYVVWDYLCPPKKGTGLKVVQTVNGMDVPAYLIPWQPATDKTIYQSVSPLNATRAGFHDMEGQVIFDVFRVDRV